MDFFKDIQNKLAELEKQAQAMHQQELQAQQQRIQQAEQAAEQQARQAQRGRRQHQPPQSGAATPISPEECGQPQRSPARGQATTPSGSILDNLSEQLGDAFLVQEILGKPMCMRESHLD